MAVLVTAAEVKQIIPTTILDAVVDAYILAADELLNNVLSGNTTLSAALKKEIERWLTAHMIAVTQKRMAAKAGAGGAYIEYTGTYGEALHSSSYGQMVLTLDTTNKFASLAGKSAKITAIQSFES